jgi:enoyl-CoA hydratase/carnithine racemase
VRGNEESLRAEPQETTHMPALKIEMQGPIATVRMVHGKANTLDLESCQVLIDTLHALAHEPVQAAVLTGSGNIFSAGVDLLRLQSEGPEYIERFVPLLSRVVLALFEFPKPLVAAINGHAIAGGCVMACTADHRVLVRGTARIGVPELLVGVPFPTAALEMVRFVVPNDRLQRIVYEGRTYSPEEAIALGLADELADAAELLPTAQARAERLAALPAAAFSMTKRQLRAPSLTRITAGAAHDAEIARMWHQPGTLDRIRSYVERTFKPPMT